MQQNANQMTVEQAVQLISNVVAQYRGTLQEHQAIQNALKVLINNANEPKIEIKAEEIEEVTK
jgi:anaerobic ribonucleoside-triphosphate reductase